MKGPRYDVSKMNRVYRPVEPSPEATLLLEELLEELENGTLAVQYEMAAVAMKEFFETTGRPQPEDIQFQLLALLTGEC